MIGPLDLSATRYFSLVAGPGGASRNGEFIAGAYEVRVFGGAVAVKAGADPVSEDAYVVIERCPAFVRLVGRVTFACVTSMPAQIWITRAIA